MPASVCQKSPDDRVSLRTSPQAGVAIPPIEVKYFIYERKLFENPEGFPRQCAHWLGMTWFFDSLRQARKCLPVAMHLAFFDYDLLEHQPRIAAAGKIDGPVAGEYQQKPSPVIFHKVGIGAEI